MSSRFVNRGLFLLLIAFVAFGAGCSSEPAKNAAAPAPAQPSSPQPSVPNRIAVIETSAGIIKVELLANEAPKTAENFKALAERGLYNGTIFHRVISGFMIQGGDPRGDGTGGQTATGETLPNEINRSSSLYQGGYKRGLVAMANKGTPETGTSQFFIMHQNYPLPPNYTVFGRVIEGIEVVDKIASAPNAGTPSNRPITPVTMRVSIQ
ncbi:MAG TPA: peptidylprolyl isomerase [Blastocatellia bacterium]|jgi:cyclophilin family peptidyl-prolyl cis-trans isomerase|nr:peptidylprolyl isomerase [Blastocatellia bacterium]